MCESDQYCRSSHPPASRVAAATSSVTQRSSSHSHPSVPRICPGRIPKARRTCWLNIPPPSSRLRSRIAGASVCLPFLPRRWLMLTGPLSMLKTRCLSAVLQQTSSLQQLQQLRGKLNSAPCRNLPSLSLPEQRWFLPEERFSLPEERYTTLLRAKMLRILGVLRCQRCHPASGIPAYQTVTPAIARFDKIRGRCNTGLSRAFRGTLDLPELAAGMPRAPSDP
ncbi:hypothetical protein BH23GEM5_BH23GEM5_27990 [soil metagenome]